MQLTTTYRGLNPQQSEAARHLLEQNSERLARLLAAQSMLRAVIEGASPEHRVTVELCYDGNDFSAEANERNLGLAIAMALTRLRNQVIRHRGRQTAQRRV